MIKYLIEQTKEAEKTVIFAWKRSKNFQQYDK